MPRIITERQKPEKIKLGSQFLERSNFLDKGDLKTTFAYGAVAIMVSFAIWGVLTSYYKQITK